MFTVALILLQALKKSRPLSDKPHKEKICVLTEIRRLGLSHPIAITTGLALKCKAVRHIYLVRRNAQLGKKSKNIFKTSPNIGFENHDFELNSS